MLLVLLLDVVRNEEREPVSDEEEEALK